jgi:hypothetical protein
MGTIETATQLYLSGDELSFLATVHDGGGSFLKIFSGSVFNRFPPGRLA